MEFQSLSVTLFFSFLLILIMMTKRGKWLTTQNPIPKLPPGPWKLPIIGNMHHLLGPLPHHTLRNLAQKHGPIMHLVLGQIPVIVVSSPRVAKEVMTTHDLSFATRPRVLVSEILSYGRKGLAFAPYGNYWRHLRKICTMQLFNAKSIASFQFVREEEALNIIQSIYASRNSPTNITEKISTYTNNVIARTTIGKRCKDRELLISALKEGFKLAAGLSVADLFPSLKFVPVITGMKFQLEKIHRKLDRMFNDIIDEHKRESATMETRTDGEDFVDVLLRLQQDQYLEFPFTTDNIKAIVIDMILGATDTSDVTIEWAMAEMMRNPEVMEKAQTEVRQALKGKAKLEEKDTSQLNYLNFVIKETLRLHPPGPLLVPKECRETCEIDGYEIPIKTRVIINAWAIGRDPQIWDNPENFIPERFDGSSIDYKGAHFELLPFGSGRRICPGIQSGIANVVLLLAHLLYYFDWKLPNEMNGKDLDMTEVFGITVPRKSNLYLIPIPHVPLPIE